MINLIRSWLRRRRQQKALRDMPERQFVNTAEAWEARKVIPGETREQARARLAKYRRTDG